MILLASFWQGQKNHRGRCCCQISKQSVKPDIPSRVLQLGSQSKILQGIDYSLFFALLLTMPSNLNKAVSTNTATLIWKAGKKMNRLGPISFNPILHGGGHFVPAHVGDPSWFLGGCPKWAHISWLCFIHHFIGPIEAIFQKKIWKFWKIEKKNFYVSTPKGPPFGKKNWKNWFFSKKIKLFTPEYEFYTF